MKQSNNGARSSLSTFAAAATTTAIVAEPLRRLLLNWGRLDLPNHRSSHTTPVPRGGGLAALVGGAAAGWLMHNSPSLRQTLGIGVLAGLGWMDDTMGHIPAPVRLSGQLIVGAANSSDGFWGTFSGAATTAGVVNVVNFMDGINGMSGLTGIVWGINAMILSDPGPANPLGPLVAGSALGFLPYNMPTAHLFLGDVGSYAMGATIATAILAQRTWSDRYKLAAPLTLYGADVAQALIHRVIHGERLGQAHRQHAYQIMVDRGAAHSYVAFRHAFLSTLLAILARRRIIVSAPLSLLVALAYLTPVFRQSATAGRMR